jgi:hypothetical protein
MTIYSLSVSPKEVIRLVRVEKETAKGQPEFYESAWLDYVIEEDFDRTKYHLPDGERYDLVSVEAILDIEPRLEQNYWILSVVARKELGPRVVEDENALVGADIALDEFEKNYVVSGDYTLGVYLDVQTPQAKEHFDHWWGDLEEQHPYSRRSSGSGSEQALSTSRQTQGNIDMSDEVRRKDPWEYMTREAIGVFSDPDALEAAVDELEISGFDQAGISVLAADDDVVKRHGRRYQSVEEMEDDPSAPQTGFISKTSRVEGEAAAVAVPFYIGGVGGAAAVVASGGALATAIAATIVGGAVGAGLGGLLTLAIAGHHAKRVEQQVAQGGLVLWVGVPDKASEEQALEILKKSGAHDVHVHEIQRHWGTEDRPLSTAQIDPFLDRSEETPTSELPATSTVRLRHRAKRA